MILEAIGFLILLIATIIHNEIIIINTPKFREKTDYYLNKDVDEESSHSFEEEEDNSSLNINDNDDSTHMINDLVGSDIE